jgi:carbamate kinase
VTRTVVALGGNTLLRRGEESLAGERRRIREAAALVADLRARDREVVLTHGNGPQVGNLLLQQEAADVPAQSLDVLVAETQAQLGYPLQRELDSRLDDGDAVTVVTQVRVDPDDPAFDEPTKPVGPFYTPEEAETKPFETTAVRTADGDTAHRRVVPSPTPVSVVESRRIRDLVERGATVIAGGGGGVPVVDDDGGLRGVEAVVDKDRTSQVLAAELDAGELILLTDVEHAYLGFGTDDQRPLTEVTPAALREYADAGEFGEGSMRPKAEACADFVDAGGERAIVTSPERLLAALDGDTGTAVTSA